MNSEDSIVLIFYGKVVAKKNLNAPRRKIPGKKGRAIRIGAEAREAIQRLEMQVPGWARDRQYVHPDLEFTFWMPEGRSDRDNMVTTLLDVLCKMKVLKNDTVASCNGRITVHPAIYDPNYMAEVVITPNTKNSWQVPKRKHNDRRGVAS